MAMPFIVSAYTLYICRRVREYLRGICPKNSMAMLGKYRRNLLDWTQNSRMVHVWTFFAAIFAVIFAVISMFTEYSNQNPSVIFWIMHGIGFVLICIVHGLLLPLSMKIPWKCDREDSSQFYVNRPKVLEARGCPLPTYFTSTALFDTPEQGGRSVGGYSYLVTERVNQAGLVNWRMGTARTVNSRRCHRRPKEIMSSMASSIIHASIMPSSIIHVTSMPLCSIFTSSSMHASCMPSSSSQTSNMPSSSLLESSMPSSSIHTSKKPSSSTNISGMPLTSMPSSSRNTFGLPSVSD